MKKYRYGSVKAFNEAIQDIRDSDENFKLLERYKQGKNPYTEARDEQQSQLIKQMYSILGEPSRKRIVEVRTNAEKTLRPYQPHAKKIQSAYKDYRKREQERNLKKEASSSLSRS